MKILNPIPVAVAALLSGLSTPSLAADFVREISHACAVTEGCFPGDGAGYPVTISETGRYRLTSNLFVPAGQATTILVSADHVDLDLGGFGLLGPAACSGIPIVCTSGEGYGAGISSGGGQATRVHDGFVLGAGSNAMSLGAGSTVTDVRIRSNRGHGIEAGPGSKVSDCLVAQNGGAGLSLRRGSVVSDSVVARNGGAGVVFLPFGLIDPATDNGSVVGGSVLYQNGGGGIDSTVVGNDAAGAVVAGNSIYDNEVDGVRLPGGGGVVSGNVIGSTARYGMNVGSSSITDNTIAGSGVLDTTASSGSFLGGNSCDGTTTCP